MDADAALCRSMRTREEVLVGYHFGDVVALFAIDLIWGSRGNDLRTALRSVETEAKLMGFEEPVQRVKVEGDLAFQGMDETQLKNIIKEALP